jgi:CzcA family heavy metal efflux pump
MLEKLMQVSLRNRLVVLLVATGLFLVGIYTTLKLPVDVFPDLTAPTVTIMTEAHGMAPEEVEMLVTFPIETVVNGASGVRRVRSNSIQGLSVVWVEFEWGTDIYKGRQIINEKLQSIQIALPEGVDRPFMAPITSIMGEIMLVGLTAEETSPMQLRTLADFTIGRRLQSIPGVSQILVYGGENKQYQIQVDPHRLNKYDLKLDQMLEAVSESNINATGGIFVESGQEYLIRGLGRIRNLQELERTVVTTRKGVPILVRDVADVTIAPAVKLGAASINKHDGVMLVVTKQPKANTLELTAKIERVLDEIRESLPSDAILHTDIFKQSDFIEVAIDNMTNSLVYGAILVVLVLAVFLVNFRTTIISVIAIPLSLIVSILILKVLGLSIDTMTLGGMAIAIGILVDDAIIYVENACRRVRENLAKPDSERLSFNKVVATASSEISTALAMASPIVIFVFVPFFFLSGMEGRMLKPLGIAYACSVFASFLVAVTVTPAMSSYLLRKIPKTQRADGWLVTRLKTIYTPVLQACLRKRNLTLGIAVGLVILAIVLLPFMGRSFLPEFNEGTLNIALATLPGTSLEESDQIGRMVEGILLDDPAVISTARRTGRTELDEHSMGSHAHEMEVRIDLSNTSKPELLERLRRSLAIVPGTNLVIGQPISHRIDHMLSGTRANIAVKIFGEDLYQLRRIAGQVEKVMEDVEGIVDLSVGQQTDIPQVRIRANREKMAMYGLRSADLDEMIDVAFLGVKVSQVFEGDARHDLVIRYAPEFRADLDAVRNSLIDTPTGARIPLRMVADITVDKGPNFISRENVRRKIVVQANVAERDLRGVVDETKRKIEQEISLPKGYYIQFGGQFESEQEATRTVSLLSFVSLAAILVLLYLAFGNFRQATLVMANLPLALIGGVMSIFLTEGVITIASLVGFVTLFGIAVRTGILMVSHYNYLIDTEGKTIAEAVLQGSLERLSPVLMTAMTTGLALLPLALAANKPGSEIQAPMSIVILGGLMTATFLNLIIVPVLFSKWGRPKVA